jgi:DNA-binding MarR family transcriptional regulator
MTAIALIQQKRRIGLTDNQVLVLMTVAGGICRLTEICEAVALAPSSVSRVVEHLKHLGLLDDSRPSVKFGRCEPAFFWLTTEGTESLRQLLGK